MFLCQTSPLNLDCPLFDVTDPDNYDTRRYDIRCGGTAVFHIPSTTQLACDAFIQQTAEYDLDNPGRSLYNLDYFGRSLYDLDITGKSLYDLDIPGTRYPW
ncbi:hypothetical protein DPMN_021375 [Dreissena polymorpha]|uniref:Uncharacterized protein n=1 Tax=Dreissena polymorpha TaxID=45954 RepID=A0A9D4NMM3_DREPO|nr:hypothetical protein DPMN_021375 [Dreissena polymorpha]